MFLNFHEKTADLLYNAVKRAAVDPLSITAGDLVIITGDTDDIVGTVLTLDKSGNIKLRTTSGIQTLRVDDTNFIHVIQKVSMLDLRKHYEYEREKEKSNKEVDMIKELKDSPKERPQFSVEKSEKSVLPTSKISLSLRKTTEG